jgi:hypothetical protein
MAVARSLPPTELRRFPPQHAHDTLAGYISEPFHQAPDAVLYIASSSPHYQARHARIDHPSCPCRPHPSIPMTRPPPSLPTTLLPDEEASLSPRAPQRGRPRCLHPPAAQMASRPSLCVPTPRSSPLPRQAPFAAPHPSARVTHGSRYHGKRPLSARWQSACRPMCHQL